MVVIILKKYFSYILLLMVLLFPISIFSENNNFVDEKKLTMDDCKITLKSIVNLDHTGVADEEKVPSYDELNANVYVNLYDIDDSITYRVTLQNDSDNSFLLKELIPFQYSPYIEYSYKYENDKNTIDAHSTSYVDVTMKLVVFPENVDDYEENNLV